jgi:bacillolysin
MTDSIRVNRTSVSGASSAEKASASKAAKAEISTSKKAVTPDAPVTNASAAAAPRAAKMSDEQSITNVGIALGKMSSAQKLFGPNFGFVKMSEKEAIKLANAAVKACNESINGAGVSPRLHGLMPALAFKDELGHSHVRLNRFFDGIPLFAEQVIAHFDDKGAVVDMTANTLPALLDISTKPKISAEAAEKAAAKGFEVAPTSVSSRLVIDKTDDGKFFLCHLVTLTNEAGDKANVFVNAENGEVLQQLSFTEANGFVPDFRIKAKNDKAFAGIKGTAKADGETLEAGEGNSIYLGKVKLNTTKSGDRYQLKDPTSGAETRDAKGGAGGSSSSSNVLYTDNDNKWADAGDPAGDKPAVDAQYAAEQFLQYLKQVFDRDSLDGKGLKLVSNVHVRRNYVNAYWDGSSMNYGDGDGRNAGPLVDKDVGSHEPMHGVTEFTSGLVYRNESGALNEAGSDVLGSAGLSWFLDGMKGSKPEYYLIGEDCWTPGTKGDALRYMDHPTKDKEGSSDMYSRDNYKSRYTGPQDGGGVHLNSGIANNFFYLLAEGGVNDTSKAEVKPGIGIEKALRIYYRAHTVYFTPNTTFAAARDAMIKAAGDLYGADSAEAKTTAVAWSAVGVESKPKSAEGGVKLIG